MLSVDVLIVGGGPAGSTIGYILQKSGLNCCIVDKMCFPRKKLCGGLLTKKTHDLIGEIFGEVDFPCELATKNVSLFLGVEKLSNILADSEFFLVDRLNFDFFFIKKFLDAKGVLFEQTALNKLNTVNNTAVLSSGDEIHYKVLVGADGANSQIRKHIDAKYRPNAMCLEFDSPATHVDDEIQVFFSAVRSGYGWCFPKKNHYTVGVGGIIKANQDIKESFKTFYKGINKSAGAENITGALIPFGKFVKKPCRDNIILIGDAAGLVDPITGEGLYFAFLSAKYASEAIEKFIYSDAELSKAYLSKIDSIQKIITDANRFNRLLFNGLTKPFFLKLVKGKTHVTKFFCENLLARYNMSYMGFVTKYIKARHQRKKSERHT